MDLNIVSYSRGQIWDEILVATMECQENGRTMWWKLGSMPEVTINELGQDALLEIGQNVTIIFVTTCNY
jgi:hypothetical protein